MCQYKHRNDHENERENEHCHGAGCCHSHKEGAGNKIWCFRILLSLLIFAAIVLFKPQDVLKIALFAVSYLIISYDIILNALKNLLNRQLLDENFLMTAATFGAFGIGEYPEALMVMVLYQTGELFCHTAVEKSRKSISNLMKIKPEFANLILKEDDGEKIVKTLPKEVKAGDLILIRPGEKIPLDAVVVEGFTSIDTSNLTGEALPRNVVPDDEIISGCINIEGLIKARVTKEYADSTVAKILEMVENASSKKAKTENFITKFARIYTPIVVLSALLLAIVPPLFVGAPAVWFERALTFLVISCPCALVISVPLSFFAALGAASKRGILIKGSCYVEALSRVKTVVFDKTGTLTEGRFRVAGIYTQNPDVTSKEELLKIAAHSENFSSHPVAKSIKAAWDGPVEVAAVKDLKEIAGKGVEARVFSKHVIVGNADLMRLFNIKMPDNTALSASETSPEAKTIVHIGIDGKYAGCISVADTVKIGAKAAIDRLKKEFNVSKTVMLTGDREAAAREIQQELEIDEIHFDLLPYQKADEVEKLKNALKPGETLLFAGDGINDAPVLAMADIGVGMGKLGSDAALEASDVVIIDDNLAKIGTAIGVSKKTIKIVKQNIAFILAVKAVCLVLGAFGVVSMWLAVFADVGVSMLAILNALRITVLKEHPSVKSL